MKKWAFGTVPAIIAADERDEGVMGQLVERVSQNVADYFGGRLMYGIKEDIKLWCRALYYYLTTLNATKSIGEEYSRLLPVDMSTRDIPSLRKRFWLWVLLLLPMLVKLPKWSRPLTLLNGIVFYWSGQYWQMARRLLALRYIEHVPGRAYVSQTGRLQLKLLAILSAVNTAWDFYNDYMERNSEHHISAPSVDPRDKCALCLNPRTAPTITPCGHVFCYQCLMNWLRRFPQCPMCRAGCHRAEVYSIRL